MVKRFNDISTDEARALQIWMILIGKAHNRQTITYKMLADMLGYKGAGVFAWKLDHIRIYCLENDLPHLTSLVVNQKTGLPGEGLGLKDSELNAAREDVYKYPWYSIIPPTPAQFKAMYKNVYSKKKN